ncbi:SixA phosphatase family protein [Poritiphilus flavus]|uniref:Histidine phosphatase family protein n=1 Tax=Poritiphilus flavus TaxID=2697053 RepID=A0A6L9EF81_9FLAO|nr:phosphoglycerate mutase family protein [Poritiphilus flavus]NAS13405.1 histidine phosphatase family protein [Poritiphilus flavus]
MKTNHLLIFAFFLITLIACKDENKASETIESQEVSTFYFIRHAEKDRSNSDDIDPELNQKGLGRAMHWAEILNDVSLDAIYTTDYERTSMTAAPSAVKQDITVQYYSPGEVDIAQFKADNLGKDVLVVGHSNTTPDFVNKMLGEERFGSMDDRDNGSLFIVQVVGNQTSCTKLNFNCNCPD